MKRTWTENIEHQQQKSSVTRRNKNPKRRHASEQTPNNGVAIEDEPTETDLPARARGDAEDEEEEQEEEEEGRHDRDRRRARGGAADDLRRDRR